MTTRGYVAENFTKHAEFRNASYFTVLFSPIWKL